MNGSFGRSDRRGAGGAISWFLVFLCAVGFPPVLHASAPPTVITRVPLQVGGSHPGLEVMVNGEGPFRFGTDTGASQAAWISRTLAERFKFPVVEGFRVSDGSGVNSRNADGVQIDVLKVGDVSFHRVLAVVFGHDSQGEDEQRVDGTIGFELFKDYVVTYDYPGQELRIATGKLPRPDGRTTLSYTLERGSPIIALRVGDLVVDARIDTGTKGMLLLPLSFADKLSLRAPLARVGTIATMLNEANLYRTELEGDVRIGEATFHHPTLLFSELFQRPSVGRDALHELVMTFDQRHRRVRFQPRGPSAGGR